MLKTKVERKIITFDTYPKIQSSRLRYIEHAGNQKKLLKGAVFIF